MSASRRAFLAAAATGLLPSGAGAATTDLRVGVQSHTATLDFQAETSNATAQFLDCLADTLIDVDTASLVPRYTPMLATAWTFCCCAPCSTRSR
jgi:ABC-type transport system substrate-binding protein